MRSTSKFMPGERSPRNLGRDEIGHAQSVKQKPETCKRGPLSASPGGRLRLRLRLLPSASPTLLLLAGRAARLQHLRRARQ